MSNPRKNRIVLLLSLSLGIHLASCATETDGIPVECLPKYEEQFIDGQSVQVPKPTMRSFIDYTKLKGSGAYGDVYTATIDGKSMAVKVMQKDPNNINEVKLLIKLSGAPAIPEFFGCEIEGEKLFLFQQLLGQEMAKSRPRSIFRKKPMLERLKILKTLADSVVYLHRNNIIHRDIKPENMLADSEKVDLIYLIDFGTSGPSTEYLFCGTEFFWSPEISRDPYNHKQNEKDDLWALTLSFAEMEVDPHDLGSTKYNRCRTNDRSDKCIKEVLENIRYYFAALQYNPNYNCGQESADKFHEAFKGGLKYYAFERDTAEKLVSKLGEAISLCESHLANSKDKGSSWPIDQPSFIQTKPYIFNNAYTDATIAIGVQQALNKVEPVNLEHNVVTDKDGYELDKPSGNRTPLHEDVSHFDKLKQPTQSPAANVYSKPNNPIGKAGLWMNKISNGLSKPALPMMPDKVDDSIGTRFKYNKESVTKNQDSIDSTSQNLFDNFTVNPKETNKDLPMFSNPLKLNYNLESNVKGPSNQVNPSIFNNDTKKALDLNPPSKAIVIDSSAQQKSSQVSHTYKPATKNFIDVDNIRNQIKKIDEALERSQRQFKSPEYKPENLAGNFGKNNHLPPLHFSPAKPVNSYKYATPYYNPFAKQIQEKKNAYGQQETKKEFDLLPSYIQHFSGQKYSNPYKEHLDKDDDFQLKINKQNDQGTVTSGLNNNSNISSAIKQQPLMAPILKNKGLAIVDVKKHAGLPLNNNIGHNDHSHAIRDIQPLQNKPQKYVSSFMNELAAKGQLDLYLNRKIKI